MGFTISIGTDSTHIVGDSITAFRFYSQAGGLVDQINRANPGATTTFTGQIGASQAAVVSGQTAVVLPAFQPVATVTASGVSGNRIHDIQIAVASRITAFHPTKLIIEIAINDANLGTVPATFLSDYQSVIDQSLAANPQLTQIGMMTGLCIGELWQAGGSPWGANPKDAAIAAINAQLVTLAANNPGVCYVLDTRTPLGLWLQQHAPGPPGNAFGIVTFDQFHPTELGDVLMAQFAMQNITVVA